MSQGSEEFIRPIAGMLKTNTTIKEINLAGNNLNAEAARIFSEGLHDNGALACDSGMVYKAPLLGSKCKNCEKGKDQHKKRCVLPPL